MMSAVRVGFGGRFLGTFFVMVGSSSIIFHLSLFSSHCRLCKTLDIINIPTQFTVPFLFTRVNLILDAHVMCLLICKIGYV